MLSELGGLITVSLLTQQKYNIALLYALVETICLSHNVLPSLVTECMSPMGMENKFLPNYAITASSEVS